MSVPDGPDGPWPSHPPHYAQNRSTRATYRRRTHCDPPNVSLGLSQGASHRSSGHTDILDSTLNCVGRDQTNTDHRHEVGVQNVTGTVVIPIHIHINLGLGAGSITQTFVISFGLFGRGDSMIMRWF
ncbi:hypothetical protein GYMLUDRAFT_247830 [Collybiopsis luxurians FD-317 M1]|uniref:Uncharacterized protein n=1 Tax=Collybiopsis luxurians FD-317 M1 TaxID=944289 RepID=A0A0D0C2Q3_9AGAR|nr:hypothetical protein GYMLUDRAFT_247830 [Collybiopsis luxurians FD-317 M1]